MKIDLGGKVAIVTGSSDGIGKSIALALASAGARVYLNARNPNKLLSSVSELNLKGLDIGYLNGDATREQFVKQSVEKVTMKDGKIDILVNNVGDYRNQASLDADSLENWNYLLGINLTSTFLWSREVVPHMKKQKSGKIINISSIAGLVGFQKSSSYTAAKGGLVALTKGMAKELGSFHINVNAIAPGVILTKNLSDEIEQDPDAGKRMEWIRTQTPLGRLGMPDDVSMATLFLASSLSDFMTGTVLNVSGGYVVT